MARSNSVDHRQHLAICVNRSKGPSCARCTGSLLCGENSEQYKDLSSFWPSISSMTVTWSPCIVWGPKTSPHSICSPGTPLPSQESSFAHWISQPCQNLLPTYWNKDMIEVQCEWWDHSTTKMLRHDNHNLTWEAGKSWSSAHLIFRPFSTPNRLQAPGSLHPSSLVYCSSTCASNSGSITCGISATHYCQLWKCHAWDVLWNSLLSLILSYQSCLSYLIKWTIQHFSLNVMEQLFI